MYMTGPSSPPYWKPKKPGYKWTKTWSWVGGCGGGGGGELRVEREEREKAQKLELP